jgi:hypothetical protein
MSLSNLKILDVSSNKLTVLPIITIGSLPMIIHYSNNRLKFPKVSEEENIELEEFKQVYVDLYHIPYIDDIDIDGTNTHYY